MCNLLVSNSVTCMYVCNLCRMYTYTQGQGHLNQELLLWFINLRVYLLNLLTYLFSYLTQMNAHRFNPATHILVSLFDLPNHERLKVELT